MERKSPLSFLTFALWCTIAAVAIVLAPLVAFSAYPLPCAGCHNEQAFTQATKASSHADVSCVVCHAGPGIADRVNFGARQAYMMLVPIIHRDSNVEYDSRCIACHDDLDDVVFSDGIKIAHETCAVGSTCTDCHGRVTHGPLEGVWTSTYEMDLCLECHTTTDAKQDCAKCHEGRNEGDRTVKGAWAVTHGPDWERTHGMGNLDTCAACHLDGRCAKCHGAGVPHGVTFLGTHGEVAESPKGDCASCHEDDFCDECHSGVEMPHPVGFLEVHSDLVDQDGDTACLNCHQKADCDTCHVAHVHPGGAVDTGSGSP